MIVLSRPDIVFTTIYLNFKSLFLDFEKREESSMMLGSFEYVLKSMRKRNSDVTYVLHIERVHNKTFVSTKCT